MILKNTRKQILNLLLFLVVLSLLAYPIIAIGVGGMSEFEVYPGETKDVSFDIQNFLEGSSDVVIEASILQGAEVVSLAGGNRVDVLSGTYTNFPFRIKVPSNAAIGAVYPASILFRTVEVKEVGKEGGGGAQIVNNVERLFNIKVVEKPAVIEESKAESIRGTGSTVWIWILIVIVIIIIAWMILRKKKG